MVKLKDAEPFKPYTAKDLRKAVLIPTDEKYHQYSKFIIIVYDYENKIDLKAWGNITQLEPEPMFKMSLVKKKFFDALFNGEIDTTGFEKNMGIKILAEFVRKINDKA